MKERRYPIAKEDIEYVERYLLIKGVVGYEG